MLKIYPAQTEEDIAVAKQLFAEYAACLGFDLCFQNFEEEMANLSGYYAGPDGCLLLAAYQDNIAGCVALGKLKDNICEMKRLYVKPKFRRNKIGRALAQAVIEQARDVGYDRMWLDFVAPRAAESLYRSLGFKEIQPYEEIPLPNAVFMELKL